MCSICAIGCADDRSDRPTREMRWTSRANRRLRRRGPRGRSSNRRSRFLPSSVSSTASARSCRGRAACDDLFTEDVGVAGVCASSRMTWSWRAHTGRARARRRCRRSADWRGSPGRLPALPVRAWTAAMVSALRSVNEPSTVLAMPISAYDRPVTAWSNHTPSTNVACLTSPSSVVFDATRRRRASSSVRSFSESCRKNRYSSMISSTAGGARRTSGGGSCCGTVSPYEPRPVVELSVTSPGARGRPRSTSSSRAGGGRGGAPRPAATPG